MSAALQGWLLGWLFWAGLSAGCLGLLMLHHLVGGHWGFAVQRRLEAAAATAPVVAVLFAPVALGLDPVYPWARVPPEHNAGYLNAPFFLARSAAVFAAWWAFAALLRRASLRQEHGEDRVDHLHKVSAAGLVTLLLTVSFAAVDWSMSLEPDWHSSLYGLDAFVGHGAAAAAFAALAAAREPEADPEVLHDLGKLLLAFVMLWAYLAFSQWLLVWSADLPVEVAWYRRRTAGAWGAAALALAAFHFLVPFAALLLRETKRRPRALGRVAALVLACRALDLLWRAAPALEPRAALFAAPAFLAVGAAWSYWYARGLALAPARPRDPRLGG